MKFTIYQDSRIGKRSSNQDRLAYCYSREALLMLVADGMGGHLHGDVASHICVQFITEAFQREARPVLPDPSMFLSRALTNAHNAILDYAFDKNLAEAPRTTVVACVVQEGFAQWAHAGDSRLYVLRRGQVAMHTKDHSRVQMMMDQGLINAEEAARHPSRNRVYSCLGGHHAPQVEFSKRLPLRDGDVLALCSDGVWGPVGDELLATELNGGDVMTQVPKVMDKAEELAGASCDNLSMVAMQWHDDTTLPHGDAVSTQTMALDNFTTQLEAFERTTQSPTARYDITDDEIEKAIAEINSAIQKYSK
ncbi:PP2C family serine/threonine-protein phosphatase [Azoarcus sp. KH32C]|uniref:PP2C family protein-serine/threonine phosphatase n=1 Tax=Azoarcus sp. KH32C TaxID=748247 RepID=UPI0002385F65|nr:protein phosphatase 2C domain-containing protein [Azoarcus sp. KH32C]BAL26725.1 putative phosphoprotein phosphatase [Azoarcus sp. KH32C]